MPPKDAVEVADTLPPEDPEEAAQPAAGPPVANWDRYELGELLGKGGMGEVYKARDRRLGRTVAIKFLRGADPNLSMRFRNEARAQARINHPNVCRVYDVGEIQGHAYIALQFIDGKPLHKVSTDMSPAEKIAVLRDVAVAVQEAHEHDIVHRDLKPANIMVEHTEAGRWFPIVMDFGLAREATADVGITVSGALLGTPAYMSPEQARGDVHAVDHRSDIYSLGATFYELLTGHPPFPSTSLAQLLAQVIHDDPPRPRSVDPKLPFDLEIIALKCLAKDPAQRYPSARALADDLGRYLDGEPILGRRLSLRQRVLQRARRNRALVTLGTGSLVIILALGVFGVRQWVIAAERARLAERLGSEATQIELDLQMAYLRPLHDTRADRKRVRKRMDTIAATHHGLGDLGDGIIYEALGRGHLALHEWREAADELDQAEHAGRQTPELHAARGRALGELYHLELEDARHTLDKEWLARRQHELEQEYLKPALDELEQSRASSSDAGLLDALIALYRRDFAAAEQQALMVAKREPGSSDALKLAADAAYGTATAAFDHGDYAAARPELEHATTLYAEASEIARSDASMYEAAAEAWLLRAEIDARQGRPSPGPFERALDLIDEGALRADPEDAPVYTTKAYVLLRWYRTIPLYKVSDQELLLLNRSVQAATSGVKLDPQDVRTWTSLGNADLYCGIYDIHRGDHGALWLDRALDDFVWALMIDPNDPRANNAVGTAHRWLGTNNNRTGRDPMPEYRAALRSYQHAAAIDPQNVPACANQVELHTTIAEYENEIGTDPRPAIDDAQRVGEQCRRIDPHFSSVFNNLARAQLVLAHYLVKAGNPTEALKTARGYLDASEAVHPGQMEIWYFRLVAANTEATFQLARGADPANSVAMGHTALEQSLKQARASPTVYVEAARLALFEAGWPAHAENSSATLLANARSYAEKAIALDHQLVDAKLMAAKACLQIATAQPLPAVIDSGINYAEDALKLNPRFIEAQTVLAELVKLRPP